ncbi:tRNA wybutosine-synthesizing protein 3 homolog [Patiria miniata]|uniref:tRNA wybutosine-synthesizing protein 3 homolog n=1 Tax=Patiria miniata TaxID=46514 RepID=A0A913Z345_PATMI|nr:tRNA wybutosine-synthesizing protein 3 homolog [Patiria miniata]
MAAPLGFSQAKTTRLKNQDLSKKGSLDEEIVDLVNCINDTDYLCTTSSCSGRIIVICEDDDVIKKKGCHWLYVSHKMADLDSVESALKDLQGNAVFKFEPFILHVQCRALQDAKLVHMAAVESGFRNSGITVGKAGKIMVAVRSTHGLEVPLSDRGHLLVSSQYLDFLVQQANAKLGENSKRIERFHTNLMKRLENYQPSVRSVACEKSCKNCCKAYEKRQTRKSARDTSEIDTSSADPMHGHSKNCKSKDLTNESQLKIQGGEPVPSTACISQRVVQTDDADTSERKATVDNCQRLVPRTVETDVETGDVGDDVIFPFDLFT